MITKHQVVGITYTLTSPENETEILDQAGAEDPLYFIFGIGATLPKFEENLGKLNSGDSFDFTLSPEDGYGDYDMEAVVRFPKSNFMIDGIAMELELGNVLPFVDQEGNEMHGEVVDITDDTVLVDFNHPMAGETLHFKGKVVEIREATKEEIEHGHVHGEHGHDH